MIEMTLENCYKKSCREYLFTAYTIVENSVTLLNMHIIFIHKHSTINKRISQGKFPWFVTIEISIFHFF